jgi:ATP adenylyltransferase
MDHLWTPWRYAYVTAAKSSTRPGVAEALSAWPGDKGCVFCNLVASVDYAIANGMSADEAERLGGLVKRGKHCFICLNAFPYAAGHVMIVLNEHLDRLGVLTTEAAHELIDMGQATERALQKVYQPHGFNIGLNVGQAGGAGVAGHLHMHALPRWLGDTNFMTTIGETRMLPEDLETTWKRMRDAMREIAS